MRRRITSGPPSAAIWRWGGCSSAAVPQRGSACLWKSNRRIQRPEPGWFCIEFSAWSHPDSTDRRPAAAPPARPPRRPARPPAAGTRGTPAANRYRAGWVCWFPRSPLPSANTLRWVKPSGTTLRTSDRRGALVPRRPRGRFFPRA